jgi:Glycosyltransferase family 87
MAYSPVAPMTDLSIDRPTASDPAQGRSSPGSIVERAWRHRHEIVGLALVATIWLAIVVFAEPWGRLWGTGQDAYCYWFPSMADPYARSDWTDPIAYVYSPAFLQVLAPLRALPWQLFMAAWTAILLGSVYVLTGRKWFVVGVVLALMELAGGNIHLVLAAAIVLGFRWPAAWSIVLLTKITPGIGLLWFVVRGEWRNLFIALGSTALIVAVSYVIVPDAWAQWFEVLTRIAGRDGTWAAVPIPFLVRLPFAIALVVWGALTGRRWAVPVAGMLALPALWYGGLTMLLAVIALREPVKPVGPHGWWRRLAAPGRAIAASDQA